jgi:hypothetical protein
MNNQEIQEIISKIIQKKITNEELDDFRDNIKSNPILKDELKKQLGFFAALKYMDDLELKKIIEQFKLKPPPEREIERE